MRCYPNFPYTRNFIDLREEILKLTDKLFYDFRLFINDVPPTKLAELINSYKVKREQQFH